MTPPVSPDLPNYRIDSLFLFKATGLDFAGSLYVRTSGKDVVLKLHILLLTCARSRAIHFQSTPDMQVPSFMRGFKRFMLRRGILDVVVSDKTFQSIEVKRFMLCYNIRLFRNSFYLPHLDGAERGVVCVCVCVGGGGCRYGLSGL